MCSKSDKFAPLEIPLCLILFDFFLFDCCDLLISGKFCNFEAVKSVSVTYLLATVLMVAVSCGCSKTVQKSAETPTKIVPVLTASFSADSAYMYVAKQVAFGPRAPQTVAHEECARWLADELHRHGADTVMLQKTDLPDFGPMTNILGRFNVNASSRIMLLAHWDTRPWADNDPDEKNHTIPIDGANDGASGVGVLLEVARQLGLNPPTIGVDILFVDAEDSGTEGDDDSWARGSQYWVENMPIPSPRFALLLDMVGGRDAQFPRELFSDVNCRWLNNKIWSLAAELGLGGRFVDYQGGAINDDHLPFLRAGIPAIDIVETNHPQTGSFNPTWHTLADNMENIDRQTLGDVGLVVTTLIYREK